jgi:hypothetical protein
MCLLVRGHTYQAHEHLPHHLLVGLGSNEVVVLLVFVQDNLLLMSDGGSLARKL